MTVTIETAQLAPAVPVRTRTAPQGSGRPVTARRSATAPVTRRRPVVTTRSRVVGAAPSCARTAPQPIAASSTVQLTRRGWVVLVAIAAAVAAVLVALAALSHAGAGDTRAAAAAPVAAGQVVVQPGDTLWSIAARVAPGRDPRAVVFDLRETNHLADSTVVEGQVLQVG